MRLKVRGFNEDSLLLFRSAFLTNVLVGIQAIASIDAVTFSIDADLNATLKSVTIAIKQNLYEIALVPSTFR